MRADTEARSALADLERPDTRCVKQADVDAGTRGGLSTTEHEELRTLRKEVKELRRANDILRAAASFFGAELDRQQKR